MQGRLVVFEGVEGCGKTTQLQHVWRWLTQGSDLPWCHRGRYGPKIVLTREPGGTDLGQQLRQLLLMTEVGTMGDRTELLLYAADRAQHVDQVLRPQLAMGALVLCDRYTDSTVVYQGYGRGLNLEMIHQLNDIATGGVDSDLTLWLDLDAELGLDRLRQRGEMDRIEQADLGFHRRVQDGFRTLALGSPHRFLTIDASRSEEEVTQAIRDGLYPYLVRWYGQ